MWYSGLLLAGKAILLYNAIRYMNIFFVAGVVFLRIFNMGDGLERGAICRCRSRPPETSRARGRDRSSSRPLDIIWQAGNVTGARERSGAQAAARGWRECLRNRVVPHPEAAPAGAAPRAEHR